SSYNAAGESAMSKFVTATSLSSAVPPVAKGGAKPAAVAFPAVSSERAGTLTITWRDMSNNELGFRIRRAPGIAKDWRQFKVIAEMRKPDANRFIDAQVSERQTYTYTVSAFNADGESP